MVALAAVINGVDVIVDIIINIIAQCVFVLKSSTKQLNNERERERDEGDEARFSKNPVAVIKEY